MIATRGASKARIWSLPLAAFLCLTGLGIGCGSDDSTGVDSAVCELVFILGNNPDPDTRLQINNALSVGLQATVSHPGFTDSEADLAPGECVAWGVFEDVFEVRLQQCNQDIAGSTECTSTFGPQVTRNVAVADGESETLQVTPNLFP